MRKNKIISLFDYTGNWSKPYKEAKYEVFQIDIKHGQDILEWDYKFINKDDVYGILAAVPCTDYAVSGAKWFQKKDKNGKTNYSNKLVKKTLEIIKYFNADFWVIENPISRIHKIFPELGQPILKFHPCDYGDPYKKMTWLWGKFNFNLKKNYVFPFEGNKTWKRNGVSEENKSFRSATPLGFAYAFFEANNNLKEGSDDNIQ